MDDVARGASSNYNTLTTEEIKALPIKDLADPKGAILAIWVPSSMLQDGLDVMKAWGFNHKQTYIWVKIKKNPFSSFIKSFKNIFKSNFKDKIFSISLFRDILDNIISINLNTSLAFGMGRLFRQTHEVCLIGVNNKGIYKQLMNKSQRSVSLEQNLKHSAKPENLQDSLEIMFPNSNKLELFARRLRINWKCLGNEVCNGEDIRVSLSKLMDLND